MYWSEYIDRSVNCKYIEYSNILSVSYQYYITEINSLYEFVSNDLSQLFLKSYNSKSHVHLSP